MNIKKIDKFISSCKNVEDLFEKISGVSPSVLKGDYFERFCQIYLLITPEYQLKLDNVWRNEEIPSKIKKKLNLPRDDEGVDLLVQTTSGEFWSIQCKYRSDQDKALTYKELSTFTTLSFNSAKNISHGIVMHTSYKPIRKRKLLKNISYIDQSRWINFDDHWQELQAFCQHKRKILKPRKQWPHNKKVVKDAVSHFLTNKKNRGKLIMPCGAGKSLCSYWIAEALNAQTILVAVPSINLISQSLGDWTQEFVANGVDADWLVICSDKTVTKIEQDEFMEDHSDLGIPSTTNTDEIVKFLKRGKQRKKVIFTTYQSARTLCKAAKISKTNFDLGILDEAHRTVGPKTKLFSQFLYEKNIRIKKRVFMTATEKIFRGSDQDIASMDNESLYGKSFHLLTYKDAIKKNIISDYKIVTMIVNEGQIKKMIENNRYLNIKKTSLKEVESFQLASALALRDLMNKKRLKKSISFHRTIALAKSFMNQQKEINNQNGIKPRIVSFHVSSKNTNAIRKRIMKDFSKEKKSLLTNARCLTEGVDVPAVDCILFADPKQSIVDIIQASGRAMRKSKGKKYGYILVPIEVPKKIELDKFIESNSFKKIINIITALSTQDERIAEEFRIIQSGRVPIGPIVEFHGNIKGTIDVTLNEFRKVVKTRVWKTLAKLNYKPYKEAQKIASKLNLDTTTKGGARAWTEYQSSEQRIADIPSNPAEYYKDKGWESWTKFLDYKGRSLQHLSYMECQKEIKNKEIKTGRQFKQYHAKGQFSRGVPSHPEDVYEEWVSWFEFCGTRDISEKKRSYEDAHQYASRLKLKKSSDWFKYFKSNNRPIDIPAQPQHFYKDKGWVSWNKFLDYENQGYVPENAQKKWRSEKKTRAYIKKMGIKNDSEWKEHSKSKKKPDNIPANLYKYYKGRRFFT
jgi:predicted helicase